MKRKRLYVKIKKAEAFDILSYEGVISMIEYIGAAVIFAAGIYLGERVAAAFAVIFTLSLIMVLTIKTIFKHKFDFKILAAALVFAAGVFLYKV